MPGSAVQPEAQRRVVGVAGTGFVSELLRVFEQGVRRVVLFHVRDLPMSS